jgi:molybdate transport system permease protein
MPVAPFLLSLEIALAATLLAAVVGVPVAALLARRRFFGREALDALLSVPLVLPPTVLGYFLLVALGRRGALGRAYESVTGAPLVFTVKAAVLAAAVSSLPLVVKFGRAAFAGVDRDVVLAARTLGASPLRAFRTVELPLAARGLVAALALAFARALGEFGATLMVAGDLPGVTQTASMAIYDAAIAGREHDANALVLVLATLSFGALYLTNRLALGPSPRE